MAAKKKATSRQTKEEKELLARRAAGQLKRAKTLAAKKKAAAASERNPIQEHNEKVIAHHGLDKEVHVAQPVLVLDAVATRQFLSEQSLHKDVRDVFLPPAPACGLSAGTGGATASPRASILLEIRQRLQDIAGQNGYILGQFAGFYERVAGAQPDGVKDSSDKAIANGVAYEIDALLNLIQGQGSKLVDTVHKLDTVA